MDGKSRSDDLQFPSSFENCCFPNNLVYSNTNKYTFSPYINIETQRNDVTSGDILYFEIPINSYDIHQQAQDYFCSLQKCFKCITTVNEEEYHPYRNDSSAVSEYHYQESTENGRSDKYVEHDYDFTLGVENRVDESDNTESNFEIDEYTGEYFL